MTQTNGYPDIDELVAREIDEYQQFLLGDRTTSSDRSILELPIEAQERIRRAKLCLATLHSMRSSSWNLSSSPASQQNQHLPKAVGRFEIRDQLGIGGFGIVYRAYDPFTKRDVALKIPRIDAMASEDLRKRFELEATAAGKLDHPNIVPILEAGTVGPIPYIASVYYAGSNLAKWLIQNPTLMSPRAAAELVRQLALAVENAHRHGVLHRDIKPSNILLTQVDPTLPANDLNSYTPKLMDFGLAKIAELAGDLTRSGAILGTLRYMSPEQAAGNVREIGPHSDIYSLGAILYELLAGQPPFGSYSDVDVLYYIKHTEPISIRNLRRPVPRELETICQKCLEKDLTRRYPTAKSLAEDLERHLKGTPILAQPVSNTGRVWKWIKRYPTYAGMLAVTISSLIALIVGLTISNYQIRLERDQAVASEKAALIARKNTYESDMRLIDQAWDGSEADDVTNLLRRHIPTAGETDIRGAEWHKFWHELQQQSQLLVQTDSIIWSLAACPDGSTFVFGNDKGIIEVRSIDPPRLVHKISTNSASKIDQILFTHDGSEMISATEDGVIRVWSFPSGRLLRELKAHNEWVGAMALTPKDDLLISGDGSGQVLQWDYKKGTCLGELIQQTGAIRCLAMNPDPSHPYVASFTETGDARLWDYKARQAYASLSEGKLEVAPIPQSARRASSPMVRVYSLLKSEIYCIGMQCVSIGLEQ